jgi:tryptophan synthase beta chain
MIRATCFFVIACYCIETSHFALFLFLSFQDWKKGVFQMSSSSIYRIGPDSSGYFGVYGGVHVPERLVEPLREVRDAYIRISRSADFIAELRYIRKHFQGRPTPVSYCRRLSDKIGGARIYLKREDLNHSGAHKLNHCMGEVLLAKYMGKKRVIAETGAGQHGVALATAAAYFGLECEIHMGEVDIAKQAPNVARMKLLGAKVVPVTFGLRTLKEAVDSAFEEYLKDPVNTIYCIGSVVGPHPFPMLVRDFQEVVGIEAREQFLEMTGNLPEAVTACVGGGSNSIGMFRGFLDDPSVELYGVEPLGTGSKIGEHAASMTYGTPGIIHGFKCYLLQDEKGEPAPVYSCASGLDYPGVGPEHCNLKDLGRVKYVTALDSEAIDAFFQLSRLEGIIPALESAHAVAYAMKLAKEMEQGAILVNLSGRGDKDLDYVIENYGFGDTN